MDINTNLKVNIYFSFTIFNTFYVKKVQIEKIIY